MDVAERLQASITDAGMTGPIAERLRAANRNAGITGPVAECLQASNTDAAPMVTVAVSRTSCHPPAVAERL